MFTDLRKAPEPTQSTTQSEHTQLSAGLGYPEAPDTQEMDILREK